MEHDTLRCAIDARAASVHSFGSGCLVLRGDLTRITVAELTRRLEAASARPRLLDARGIRFAELPAIAQLVQWIRRRGSRMRLVGAPEALIDMIERYHFEDTLQPGAGPVACDAPQLSRRLRTARLAA